MLRAGHANRQRQTYFVANTSADGGRDLGWRSEEMDGARNIEKGLIYRHPLDSRGEVMKDRHDIVAKLLVTAEVATDEEEITAKLAVPPSRHAAADTKTPGFIRRRQH